jgi:hypothetical protein
MEGKKEAESCALKIDIDEKEEMTEQDAKSRVPTSW